MALIKYFISLGDNCRRYYLLYTEHKRMDKASLSEHNRYFNEMQQFYYDFKHGGKGSSAYIRRELGR